MKRKIKLFIMSFCLIVTLFLNVSNTVSAMTPNWYERNKEAVKIAGNLNLMFKTNNKTEETKEIENKEELNFTYYFKNMMSKFNFK